MTPQQKRKQLQNLAKGRAKRQANLQGRPQSRPQPRTQVQRAVQRIPKQLRRKVVTVRFQNPLFQYLKVNPNDVGLDADNPMPDQSKEFSEVDSMRNKVYGQGSPLGSENVLVGNDFFDTGGEIKRMGRGQI